MATSHPTQHSRSQSEDESEPAEQGFEIVDVDHSICNRAHRHRPNTLAFAFALPTSFRSPSNHGNEEDDNDDDDEEEEVIEDDDDEPAPASSTRTFMHLPFTKIKTPQKAHMTNIFILSLLCLLGGVGVAVHFVRRYSGDRTTVIAINKNLAFTTVGGYNFVEVFNADSLGGECTDIANERYNYISYNLDNDGNVTECAEKCSNCPGQGQVDGQPLLGVTVEVDNNSCFCNLDATASGYGMSTCADAVGASTLYGTPEFSGTGDIVSTDGDSLTYACYKVVQTGSKSNKKPESSSKGSKTPTPIRN